MLDISFRSNKPRSILVYSDGADARLFKKLISMLGSEEKVHNAIILTGFIAKQEKREGASSAARAKRARDSFEELVGISYQEFQRLVSTL